MGTDEDVLQHTHPREQLEVLEGAGDPEPDHADRPPVEDDVAPVEPVEAGDRVEGGRLAGAVRSDQPRDRPFGDLEGDVVERDDPAEAQSRVVEREERHGQSAACSDRPPADCIPASIPGGAAPSGKRASSSVRSASGSQPSGASSSSPAVQPCRTLTAPPQMWMTWPVIACASLAQSATTTAETFAGSSGSKPSGGAAIWNVSSVMRVRAFGARQLTVTPYRWSSWAAMIVKPAMAAFAAP